MRHYTAPTLDAPLVQAGLENPSVVEEMPERDRPDNADFDREPVKPTTYKEPDENPLTLLEGFQERIIHLQGSPGPVGNGAGTYQICEIPGPKAGYVWDIRRLAVYFPNYLLTGTAPTSALTMFFAVPAGSLVEYAGGFPEAQTTPERWRYLTTIQIPNPTNFVMLEPQTFGRLEMTLLPGWNLGVLQTTGLSADGGTIVDGQASEIPEALLRRIK